MTKEQAVNYLKSSGFSNEAIAEITAALTQPCTDTISREAAINACFNGWNKDFREIAADIRELPPVKVYYNELLKILNEVAENCAAKEDCSGCRLDTEGGCSLRSIPAEWKVIDLIKESEE